MEFAPTVNSKQFAHVFQVIDTHTAGEATRIVTGGMPVLQGDTMMEKKEHCQREYDHLRRALMHEPRGHRDMFGAILTDPIHEEAHVGVVFMDTKSYLNMCGHGTIGVSTALVETGLIPVTEPYTEVVLDAPSGLIRVRVEVENRKAKNVTFRNVPSFLYKEALTSDIDDYMSLTYDIAFGGQFFAMVDARQLGLSVAPENVQAFIDIGSSLLQQINRENRMHHPTLPITTVDLVEFYGPGDEDTDMKNIVIFGNRQADRSPCGTGTCAKLAVLHARGEIRTGEALTNESFIGSQFIGRAAEVTKVGDYDAIIPEITGSAFLTGFGEYYIDPDDPFAYGFTIDAEPV
ncbi:MAG: proline racemase family protein [Peptoniphilaceae bacterium]|jgi:proline racemase